MTLPLADLDNRKALAKTLTNFGAYFSNIETKNKRALDKLIASQAQGETHKLCVTGWLVRRRL